MSQKYLGNPYVDARNEWDDRYDRLTRSRRNWQLYAFCLLLLDVFLVGALYHLATTSRITPYVVEVDRHGHALAFGPAETLANPDERIWRYAIASFVRDLRTVYAEGSEAAQRETLKRADAYLRPPATARVASWFSAHNPFTPGRNAVAVDVTSVLKLSDNVWQVQWSETHMARDGATLRLEPWQALLTVAVDPPTSSERILANPLGLFVTQIDWNLMTKETR